MSEFNCNDCLRETNERQSFFCLFQKSYSSFLEKHPFSIYFRFHGPSTPAFNDAPCVKPQNLKPFLVLSKRYTIFNDRGSVGNVIASCKSCLYAKT